MCSWGWRGWSGVRRLCDICLWKCEAVGTDASGPRSGFEVTPVKHDEWKQRILTLGTHKITRLKRFPPRRWGIVMPACCPLLHRFNHWRIKHPQNMKGLQLQCRRRKTFHFFQHHLVSWHHLLDTHFKLLHLENDGDGSVFWQRVVSQVEAALLHDKVGSAFLLVSGAGKESFASRKQIKLQTLQKDINTDSCERKVS